MTKIEASIRQWMDKREELLRKIDENRKRLAENQPYAINSAANID